MHVDVGSCCEQLHTAPACAVELVVCVLSAVSYRQFVCEQETMLQLACR
jgi:hypothetical protein